MFNQKTNTLKKNINFNLVSTVFSMLTLFILTPFIIKHLGAEEYGIYVILGTLIGFLGIMDLGLGGATIYYVANYYKKHDFNGLNSVFSATFWVYFILGVILLISLLGESNHILKIFNMQSLESIEGMKLIAYWNDPHFIDTYLFS